MQILLAAAEIKTCLHQDWAVPTLCRYNCTCHQPRSPGQASVRRLQKEKTMFPLLLWYLKHPLTREIEKLAKFSMEKEWPTQLLWTDILKLLEKLNRNYFFETCHSLLYLVSLRFLTLKPDAPLCMRNECARKADTLQFSELKRTNNYIIYWKPSNKCTALMFSASHL